MGRGSIRRRGRNSWEISVRIGRDPATGKYLRVFRTVHGTWRDAEAALLALMAELGKAPQADSSIRLWDWLRQWLDDGSRRWSPTTLDRYVRLMHRYAPPLANVRLRDLKPLHVQQLLNKLLDQGVSATTVNNFYRALRTALEHAVHMGLLGHNPCTAVRPPSPRKRTDAALSPEQVAAVVHAARQSQWWLPILLAATTGLRRGEILGLRWRDIDWEEGVLWIRQTVVQVNGRPVFREPKTAHSRRAVYVDAETLQLLREHRRRQNERRLAAGPTWRDHDLVFCNDHGEALEPARFSKAFAKYARKAGVDARLHDLRHTHGSALLAEGWPVTVVSERLGHATPQVTAAIYAHVLPGLQRHFVRGGSLTAKMTKSRRNLPGVPTATPSHADFTDL